MARDWLDAVFKYRDLDLADRFVAVDVALVSDGQIQNGPIAMRRQWSQILAAFDPIEYHVEEIVSSSDAIAAFWSWRGKHVAKYGELPATCQWATGKGCTLMRRCGDQIAVIREHHDIAPVLRARQDCTD